MNRIWGFTLAGLAVALALILIYKYIVYPVKHVSYKGIIKNVVFDIKGYSKFQVYNDSRWHTMSYLDCDLKIGDSMVKRMDDSYIYQYRGQKLIGVYNAGFGYRYYYDSKNASLR